MAKQKPRLIRLFAKNKKSAGTLFVENTSFSTSVTPLTGRWADLASDGPAIRYKTPSAGGKEPRA